MTPQRFRERFPIFQKKTFLNSCSKGALSREVEEAYGQYLDSWRGGGSPWEEWVAVLERARSRFAALCGASEDEIAITFCASTAVASLASALSFDGPRKRVLLGDFEFPTMAHNWLVQERRGAAIVRVRARNGRLPVSAYREALDERTLIVPVATLCFRNGYLQDVESVVGAARQAGALTLVDDYQSTGTRPLDVKKLGCDFLVTGALKYLMGSSGLAFLYVRNELIDGLEPLFTGWFGQERPFDFDIERATYHRSARRFESGTPPIPNLYAGFAGLSLFDHVELGEVRDHVEGLATTLIAESKERGFEILTPAEPESRGPLVVLKVPDAPKLVQALDREDVIVSARGDGLRVSFHYYNVPED
ncbi:MAG TPA: aminotransferase class V-fold PLP-dependent enzyme, partial [Vicinamibacteria bacterium]|nr:aminotransferase class V-fold PLP-dependent enzyme [Vicinamibacteria bacterium]